ncbi:MULTISPECIES: MFS transporter [Burkholderia]|uniref:MFS transporter n=1 Tax=Burkholderia TaxID=32008 RepID=UPI001452ACB8|nr:MULTISPECIES: MFS transporter [Burkholderia]MBN3768284.1 MFS transporter [Burkholderia sp. Se-20378]MBN3793788.1 MFS transporter [Burkholderia sp. Ac-20392]VWB27983.1 MFS transporter [Burkholderia lata]
MKLTPARARLFTLRHLRSDLLPWAIALSVGIDYFDNSIFSFFTSYIAGGINASPDELVWSSTAYATASVLGIVQQQWLIERLGFRRYLSGCLLMFAAGSLAASLSESSMALAMARGFQGYFIGPMLGTCRIMLQTGFTPEERAPATRIFLVMILLASALAPMAGGYLVAHFDWRALFLCSTVGGAALSAFTFLVVPHIGRRPIERRSDTHLWPYLVFAIALGALQIVAQQLRFEVFSTTPLMPLATVAGLTALGWFAWHQWHDPRPLLRVNALREGPFRQGIVLYAFYYFISNAIGFLISRLLQSGLGYPVENAGRLVGLTSLTAIPMAIAYFKYARLIKRKWLIVPGFAMAAAIGIWVLNLPPDVSMGWLLPPLVLRGFLLMFIALPTASAAFQIFSNDEFTHGYRFKNVVKQLAYSLSTATFIIVDQHRTAVHQTRLVEFANPYNPVFVNTLDTMTHAFEAQGMGAAEARGLSLGQIAHMVAHQASFLSALDGFEMIVGLALVGGTIAFVQRQIR